MSFLKKCFVLSLCFYFSTAHASQKLVVLLDWFANPTHAPLFVAQAQGFFKEKDLDVELIGPADPSDPPKLVAAGKADIALTYEPSLMEQVQQGLPLIRIATLIDQPLNCLVVLKNSSINSIEALRGKKIGYSSGGVTNVSLNVMLKNHGLTKQDVEEINVHYDLTQALLAHKVDAVIGMMRNFELLQLEIAGEAGHAFFPEKNGVPPHSELIFVVNKNTVHDPRYKKFIDALQKGVLYLEKHPQETWEQFAKLHPELNDELNKRAWFATLPYFARQPSHFDPKSWLRYARFMHQNGLLQEELPIDRYAIELKG